MKPLKKPNCKIVSLERVYFLKKDGTWNIYTYPSAYRHLVYRQDVKGLCRFDDIESIEEKKIAFELYKEYYHKTIDSFNIRVKEWNIYAIENNLKTKKEVEYPSPERFENVWDSYISW